MCPDLVRKNSYSGQAADVWALGVILFILATGRLPFHGDFEGDLFRRIQQGKYQYPDEGRERQPDGSQSTGYAPSPALKSLVRKIFEPTASLRITADQILTEPWLLQHCPPPPTGQEEQPKSDPDQSLVKEQSEDMGQALLKRIEETSFEITQDVHD